MLIIFLKKYHKKEKYLRSSVLSTQLLLENTILLTIVNGNNGCKHSLLSLAVVFVSSSTINSKILHKIKFKSPQPKAKQNHKV